MLGTLMSVGGLTLCGGQDLRKPTRHAVSHLGGGLVYLRTFKGGFSVSLLKYVLDSVSHPSHPSATDLCLMWNLFTFLDELIYLLIRYVNHHLPIVPVDQTLYVAVGGGQLCHLRTLRVKGCSLL